MAKEIQSEIVDEIPLGKRQSELIVGGATRNSLENILGPSLGWSAKIIGMGPIEYKEYSKYLLEIFQSTGE